MEQVSTLECMKRLIQLKNEYSETKNKLTSKKEDYIRIYTAILEEQISYPTMEASLEQTRKDLHSARVSAETSHQIGNNKEEEDEERRLYVEHLENLERKYSQILINLDYPNCNLLEKEFEKCRNLMKLYEEKMEEINNESFHLIRIIRLADKIKVNSCQDTDMVFLFREKIRWSGKISLAEELDTSQKHALISYIYSKRQQPNRRFVDIASSSNRPNST